MALGEDGWPYFPAVCDRVLHGDKRIRLTFVAFDLLELKGESTTRLPLTERRRLLGELELNGRCWQTSSLFDDGEALFAVAVEHGLEGVVAKRTAERHRPGERSWVKTKNRTYWRYDLEVEALRRSVQRHRNAGDSEGVSGQPLIWRGSLP